MRELLSFYQFDGDNTPIIRGSALGALNGDAQWEDKVMELRKLVILGFLCLRAKSTSRS